VSGRGGGGAKAYDGEKAAWSSQVSQYSLELTVAVLVVLFEEFVKRFLQVYKRGRRLKLLNFFKKFRSGDFLF
jgi:hypothetical protein